MTREIESPKKRVQKPVAECEPKVGHRIRKALERHVAIVETKGRGSPRDDSPNGDGNQTGGHTTVTSAAKPSSTE